MDEEVSHKSFFLRITKEFKCEVDSGINLTRFYRYLALYLNPETFKIKILIDKYLSLFIVNL